MPVRLPVRRYLQSTDKTETPSGRFGGLQWVLSRPMYRFRVFDLTQVPPRNRNQALNLELAQWTPFVKSDCYIGWHGQRALVWAWDADRAAAAIIAQGIKVQKVQILPETVLQTPLADGLCLSRCLEGYEGQLWRQCQLEHSRWWPQQPTQDEWLTFQRDAAIVPSQQQQEPPTPRQGSLGAQAWVLSAGSASAQANQAERLVLALGVLLLILPTFWYGISLFKLQDSVERLHDQRTQLQREVEPISTARSQALDYLARINLLRTLAPYPDQLTLMDHAVTVWRINQGKDQRQRRYQLSVLGQV
jgi:hypothetical protein